MKLLSLVIVSHCFVVSNVLAQFTGYVDIPTVLGPIRGLKRDGVEQYLGVPYAQPPIGENRFMPPDTSGPLWEGRLNATNYPPSCLQEGVTLNDILQNSPTTDDGDILLAQAQQSEDCLYLNIFTPDEARNNATKLPVMVFIHGGEFSSGTGSVYKGAFLSLEYDVIVVTLNYRLGPFGFLSNATSNFQGNYGILDQQAALEWVKQNIHSFGGNADEITILGEGAGGSSAHIHVMMGMNGMFQNAIIQSPQYDDAVWTERQCQDQFQEFISTAGIGNQQNPKEELNSMTAAAIVLASQNMVMNTWRPCRDGENIADSPHNILQRSDFHTDVNIMVGSNTGAGAANGIIIPGDDTWLTSVTEQIFTDTFPQAYGSINSTVIDSMSKSYFQFYTLFGSENLGTRQRESFTMRAYGDQLYHTWAQEISRETGGKCNCSVYEYLFARETDADQGTGAPLSAELSYIFGYTQFPTLEENNFAELLRRYWTNFAKTGNPNQAPTLDPHWPAYETVSGNEDDCRSSFYLDLTVVTTNDRVTPRNWEFWTDYYTTLGFSCLLSNDSVAPGNPHDNVGEAPQCEPTVKDAIGMAVTNEEAAIMLICFIVFTGIFLISTIFTAFGCYVYKKRTKKLKKRMKKEFGTHENPASVEYKL